MNGRGVINIGLEKKYGLRPSCLLYSRGGRGKGIHTEGGISPCSRGSEGKLSWTVVQLAGSRRSEQGCEVPHDGPLFAEADK